MPFPFVLNIQPSDAFILQLEFGLDQIHPLFIVVHSVILSLCTHFRTLHIQIINHLLHLRSINSFHNSVDTFTLLPATPSSSTDVAVLNVSSAIVSNQMEHLRSNSLLFLVCRIIKQLLYLVQEVIQ